MSALAALVPSWLRRRKRSAEEEEARQLRAALRGVDRAAVEDKCLELHAANRALAQRCRELENAAASATTAAVEDDDACDDDDAVRKAPRLAPPEQAQPVPTDTPDASPSCDEASPEAAADAPSPQRDDAVAVAAAVVAAAAEPAPGNAALEAARAELLARSAEDQKALRLNANVVCAHEPEGAGCEDPLRWRYYAPCCWPP
jgi:hypothetical protein